jgi:hypothetical protein
VRVGAFFAAVGLALGLAAQTPPSLQRFKSSIDLVQVDVSAVDAAGRPIRDLTAADFELRVDSRPRPIVSAQFVSVPSGTAESPSTTTPAHYSSNADWRGDD